MASDSPVAARCPVHGRRCWHGPYYRGARRDHRAALRRDVQERQVRHRRKRKPAAS